MILSVTWRGSFYVCLTEPPDFSHGEHQDADFSNGDIIEFDVDEEHFEIKIEAV